MMSITIEDPFPGLIFRAPSRRRGPTHLLEFKSEQAIMTLPLHPLRLIVSTTKIG